MMYKVSKLSLPPQILSPDDFKVSLNWSDGDVENTKVVTTREKVFYTFSSKYYDWSFFLPPKSQDPYIYFRDLWHNFVDKNLDNWNKMFNALMQKYDPLRNYDRTQKDKTAVTGVTDRDRTFDNLKTTDVQTYDNYGATTTHGTITDTPIQEAVTTNQTTSYDNTATFRDATRTLTHLGAPGSTDTKSSTLAQGDDGTHFDGTVTHDITNSGSFKDKVTVGADGKPLTTDYDSHVYGNIGVTTNMKMIKEEIALRESNSMYDKIVEQFVKEYLILMPGGDDDE